MVACTRVFLLAWWCCWATGLSFPIHAAAATEQTQTSRKACHSTVPGLAMTRRRRHPGITPSVLMMAARGQSDAQDDVLPMPDTPAATPLSQTDKTIPRWLLLLMVFLHVLGNSLIAQALPKALRLSMSNDLVRTATRLGQLGSCAAMLDILITPQVGRLTDTIGRKPVLIAAPLVGSVCRGAVALRPATPFLIAVKVLGGVISASYMVTLRAAIADGHRKDATSLTGRFGLMQAASGASYAVGMYAGGELVARQLRLPYAVSATLLASLVPLIAVFFRETLSKAERVRFRPSRPGIGFIRLFTSGATLRGLCTVNTLQLISISMGDTWQVFARELRGWGSRQCGLFGSLTGFGGMLASLAVRSSVRVLGTRGHTLLATGCVIVTELILGGVQSSSRAFVALLPNWIGRTQTMAVVARVTSVGATVGFGQGELAGDRQNLHALIKVAGPFMYGSLFAFGCRIGVPALPFYFAATVGFTAWLLVLLSPSSVWNDQTAPEEAAGPPPQPESSTTDAVDDKVDRSQDTNISKGE